MDNKVKEAEIDEKKEDEKEVFGIEEDAVDTRPSVLWVSDLVTPTGFSRVSHSIIEFLHEKYKIIGLGINYRGDPHSYKFPIFPASISGRIFGEDRLVELLNNKKFDILYILNDVWIIDIYLRIIKEKVNKNRLPKIVVYFPVDSSYHSASWYQNFDIVTKAVTYTKFGKNEVTRDDCAPDLNLDLIPHGVNQSVFYNKYVNKKRDAKIDLFRREDSGDYFIFLNANRNQPRKRLDITMEAFKLFSDGKEDVKLYMHSGIRDAHIDLVRLSRRLGIEEKLILTSTKMGVQTVSESVLNSIYNACDVGVNSSMGEGWGLCSIEHAITGAPQIIPNHSALTEIFAGCGEFVEPKLKYTFDNSMTVGMLVDPIDLAKSMEKLYSDAGYRNALSELAIKKFSQEEYSWEHIAKKWDKVFEEALQ